MFYFIRNTFLNYFDFLFCVSKLVLYLYKQNAMTMTQKNKKVNNKDAIGKCQNCKKNNAKKLHTCPYREDNLNDNKTLCNCCDNCGEECFWLR